MWQNSWNTTNCSKKRDVGLLACPFSPLVRPELAVSSHWETWRRRDAGATYAVVCGSPHLESLQWLLSNKTARNQAGSSG